MKKNKLILLQLVIAFMFVCTSVYATVSTTISVSASSTSVKSGEEVTITLALEDVESNKAVESVEGYINYNKDIFETVTVDNIEKTASNKVKIGDETLTVEDVSNGNVQSTDSYVAFNGSPSSGNDIKIVIDFKDGITKNTELLKITFKVKSGVDAKTYTNAISYETFQITAGNETGADITKNVNVTVVSDTTSDDDTKNEAENTAANNVVNNTTSKNTNNTSKNTNNTSKNTNTNNTSKNTNNTNKNTNKNTNNTNTNKSNTNKNTNTNDSTVAGTTLPATGSKIVVLPAIILIALAYVSYNKYMKYKDI